MDLDSIIFDLTGGLRWFLGAWLACLGGVVGSFMNVVVYRSPLGLSVAHPGSRCPKCKSAIRWYDNIPVLSWVLLGARCRQCKIPISARYPIVEGICVVVFFAVAFAEVLSGGDNLPGVMPMLRRVPVTLLAVYGCQMLFIYMLICSALIEFDGHRIPVRFLLYPMFVGAFLSPYLTLLPPLQVYIGTLGWADGFTGLAVGGLLGLAARTRSLASGKKMRSWPVLEFAGCGVILGWQMTSVVACTAVVAYYAAAIVAMRVRSIARIPRTAYLVFAVVLAVIFFERITEAFPYIANAGVTLFFVAAVLIAAASVITGKIETLISDEDKGGTHTTMDPQQNLEAIVNSPSYRLAELDTDFLQRQELRPVRLQLELLKPEMAFLEQEIKSTIVAFGGTQIVEESAAQARLEAAKTELADAPDDVDAQRAVARAERILAKSKYYDAAREFGRVVSSACQTDGTCDYVIITGGGPGIMEAANRGAMDVGAKSIGLNITLPSEQQPNSFITPELCFQFHYFALRKMHFLMRAKALVVFPGGFGTLDELFDALTLRQTNRMQAIPIVLIGREYWDNVINFQFLADEGVIADDHLNLISYAETPEEAWDTIRRFHDGNASTDADEV